MIVKWWWIGSHAEMMIGIPHYTTNKDAIDMDVDKLSKTTWKVSGQLRLHQRTISIMQPFNVFAPEGNDIFAPLL